MQHFCYLISFSSTVTKSHLWRRMLSEVSLALQMLNKFPVLWYLEIYHRSPKPNLLDPILT